jgi:NOL1/NOP2/fmu family ribosome biogenesis protein
MATGDFESIQLSIPTEWGIVASVSPRYQAHGYRFYPNRIQGEGFFCAVLKKKVESQSHAQSSPNQTHVKLLSPELSRWVNSEFEWISYQKENEVYVQLEELWDDINGLDAVLKLRKKSLRLGNLIRDELIPDHELAVSASINNDCNQLDLTRDQAISYLKREELNGLEGASGWYWITYNGTGLGWAKMAGGKFKNHYPMNWRILKQN